MKKALFFLLSSIISLSMSVSAQNKQVTGVITDAKDGSGLPGVSVTVKEVPGIGTQTDGSGH